MMTKDSHHGNSNCRSTRHSRPKRSGRSGISCCRCQGKTIVARQPYQFVLIGCHIGRPEEASR